MHGLEHLGSDLEATGSFSNTTPLQAWPNYKAETVKPQRDTRHSAMPARVLGRMSGYGAGVATATAEKEAPLGLDTRDTITEAIVDERLRRTGF